MSKQLRFSVNEKLEERKTLGSRKQCHYPKNTCSPIHKTQRQFVSSNKSRTTLTRPAIQKRGKILRISERTDASSTSTNLSEKEKMDNLLQLKKEINEWKRQEKLRSRVNELLGKAAVGTDNSESQETSARINDSPRSIPIENSEDRMKPTLNMMDNNQDMDKAQPLKLKSKKQKNESIPAVTWIPIQPETSARTSLKSFADFLSEVEDDMSTPKRRLCLSPETLNTLDNAEKLLEDAEKQISHLNYDSIIKEDVEADKLDDRIIEAERIYARNIVASTFQKGFYDPEASIKYNKQNLKSKLTLTQLTKPKPVSQMYNSSRSQILLPSPKSFDKTNKATIDDCLLCKSRKNESANKIFEKDKPIEPCNNREQNLEEKKIEEDKPEKLNVQKGPIISIMGDLSIQTSNIIDIHPTETDRQLINERCENIATYEFRHNSFHKEKSIGPSEIPVNDNILHKLSIADDNSNRTNLEQEIFRPRRKNSNKSILNKQNVPLEPKEHSIDDHNNMMKKKEQIIEKQRDTDFWKGFEDVNASLDELSLSEPLIIMEVDSLLDQQRQIIRRVHQATDKFDKFLSKRLPDDTSLSSESKDNLEDYYNKERKKKKNNTASKKKNEVPINDYKSIEPIESPNEISNIISKVNTLDMHRYPNTSAFHDFKQLIESVPKTKKILSVSHNKPSNDSSIISKASCVSQKVSESSEKDLNLSGKDLISETSNIATQYEDSFDYASSINKSVIESDKSNSHSSETKDQEKKVDKESSSNNSSIVETSEQNKTKSNAGFIENLKSLQILKENNLDANLHQKLSKDKSEILKSIENITTNENRVNKRFSDKGIKKDFKKKDAEETKENQLKSNVITKKQNLITADDKNYPLNETTQQQNEEKEKHISYMKSDEDKNNKKLEHHQETSQKTSHLIESISHDIPFHKTVETSKSSQDTLRLSNISNGNSDSVSKTKNDTPNESNQSTESKIENKLSEARDNLNTLMKTINGDNEKFDGISLKSNSNDKSNNKNNDRSSDKSISESYIASDAAMKNIIISREEINKDIQKSETNASKVSSSSKNPLVHGDHINKAEEKSEISIFKIPQSLKNDISPKYTDSDKRKAEMISLDSTILINQEHNLSNTRSFISILEENSKTVQESMLLHRVSLLKKLESCSIPSNYQSKRLFTSTILGDTEPPNSFAKLKSSSESSETHSEGEVCLNSSASYSLGEIRRKSELSKSSLSTKGSSNSSNFNASIYQSSGEVQQKNIHFSNT